MVKLAFCVDANPSKSIFTPLAPRAFIKLMQFCVKVFFAVVDVKNVECDENKVAQKEILTPFAFAAVTALLVDHAKEALLFAPVVGFTV